MQNNNNNNKLKNQFGKETNEGFIGNSFLNSKHTKISPW